MLWLALQSVTQMITGPAFAVINTLVPERMRATAIALIYLFANLIGMGLGPWATGALSDFLRPWAGEESLRYALLALSPGTAWMAVHFWKASKSVGSDLSKVHHASEGEVAYEATVGPGNDKIRACASSAGETPNSSLSGDSA
jgi:MFS family permease